MDKFNSRKYKLAKYIIAISTFLTFIPPLITIWFFKEPLVILTGTEFVSILSATLLFYSGSNLVDKHLDNQSNKPTEEVETEEEKK